MRRDPGAGEMRSFQPLAAPRAMKISRSLIGLNLRRQLQGENLPEAAPALGPGVASHVPSPCQPPGSAAQTGRRSGERAEMQTGQRDFASLQG